MLDEISNMMQLMKAYNVLDETSNMMQKRFDNEIMYNEKYSKTKIKPVSGKINTNFHNVVSIEGSHHICLSVTLIDSVFQMVKTIIHKYFWKSANLL